MGPEAGARGGARGSAEARLQAKVARRIPDVESTGAAIVCRESARVRRPGRKRSAEHDASTLVPHPSWRRAALPHREAASHIGYARERHGFIVPSTGVYRVSGKDHAACSKRSFPRLPRRQHGRNTARSTSRAIEAAGIVRANLIDATPIGINVRSTVATYCGALDDMRRAYARTDAAKAAGLEGGRFLIQHGKPSLRDMRRHRPNLTRRAVPTRRRHRLPRLPRLAATAPQPTKIRRPEEGAPDDQALSLPHLMAHERRRSPSACVRRPQEGARQAANALHDLGLGYLTLGEATPALSGGEAQRLKLASEMGNARRPMPLFVFDEPTIGLHPRDVRHAPRTCSSDLVEQGATVVVIEHDLDFIAQRRLRDRPGAQRRPSGRSHRGVPASPSRSRATRESITGGYLEI